MGNANNLIERVGKEKAAEILANAHIEAVYYVDEYSEHFKVHGFCSDKCIVGIHNPHTHYKLDDLRNAMTGAQ